MYARIDVITTDRWQIYWINQRLSGVVIDTQSNLRPHTHSTHTHTQHTHTLWAESNHSVMYISSSVSPFNINASPQWGCTPAPIAANCPTHHNKSPSTHSPSAYTTTSTLIQSLTCLTMIESQCVLCVLDWRQMCWMCSDTSVLLWRILMFVFRFGWDSSEVCVITFWFD